jgi:hypothetical protein
MTAKLSNKSKSIPYYLQMCVSCWEESPSLTEMETRLCFSYVALGLTHTLNPIPSGGVEHMEVSPAINDDIGSESTSCSVSKDGSIPEGFGRIIRDQVGNILHIEMAEGEDEELQTTLVQDMEVLAPKVDNAILERWSTNFGVNAATKTKSWSTNVIQGEFFYFFIF